MFAVAEENGRDGEVHFVDVTGLEVLANGGDAAADADVFAVGRFHRLL